MKESFKQITKLVFNHFLLISTILIALMGFVKLIAYLSGDSVSDFPWYFPFQVIGVSFPTALCSYLYIGKKELTKNQFLFRIVIHFILLICIVLGEGFAFKWYGDDILDIIPVIIVFLIVYALVWIITSVIDKKNSDNINKALHNIRKIEENDE